MRWPRRTSPPRALLLVAVAVASLAALPACSRTHRSSSTSPTTRPRASSTSTATTSSHDAEAEVRRVVTEWNREFDRLATHPDPDDPAIAKYTAGAYRRVNQDFLRERQSTGEVFEPGPDRLRSHRVLGAEATNPNEARVDECAVNDWVLKRVADGAVIDDEVVTKRFRTHLVFDAGRWRIDAKVVVAKWNGVVSCVP